MINYDVYERGSASLILKGWVKAADEFQVDIDAYPDVLNIISSGYKCVPLLHMPIP